ncbi:MAG: mechanosensitive ion channel protein [Candidatus Muiribacterium halophilum]|uniref:Mechanosensitive ion channel protein n=1 Tax=Muiribacterium halophilum TaxID=2053465 RepID=A0A2N5ZIY1_MUIH1|nr:MAG: mechanosensitive ion channel protein [Candidatus Muirbacterium halophilum]
MLKKQIFELWIQHKELVIEIGYKALLTLLTILFTFIISKLIKNTIITKLNKMERFDKTLLPLTRTIIGLSIYTVGLVIILDIFGVNTNSIVALLGAAGIAIGLALKDTLSNIAAGIMILILRPLEVGDFIECAGNAGTVSEVGLFTTILKTPDGLYISVPNSNLSNSSIKNFTKNGTRRIEIVVGISYNDSIDKAFEVLNEIIKNEDRFLLEPAPTIAVQSMGDSSINIHLRAWAKLSDYWDIHWKLNKLIKEEIEKAGLTIPYPQRDVHMINK